MEAIAGDVGLEFEGEETADMANDVVDWAAAIGEGLDEVPARRDPLLPRPLREINNCLAAANEKAGDGALITGTDP